MNYPKHDNQFEEIIIASVKKELEGWSIERADGWSFFVPEYSRIEPKEGMKTRFYGKGIGYTVRGLFIDGFEVFYRTEAQDKEKHETDTYGADATEWLKRWDENKSVWSISMGGFGPGYEQAIQIAMAEVLRHLLDVKYNVDDWSNTEAWKIDKESIEQFSFKNKKIESMGLSGNQWDAAFHLAIRLYRKGPIAVMKDEQVKDRHIQVTKTFPQG